MERNRGGRPRHPDILTPAEQRVLEELRAGGTNAEIAVRLGVSPDAVKYHISNMLGKLELADRHQLAAWRPDTARSPRQALLALPLAFGSLARPLVWAVAGVVALAGIAALVVVLVVVTPPSTEKPQPTDCEVVGRADGPVGAPAPGGAVTGGATVVCGEMVTLTATAKGGYCFSHWGNEAPSEGCPLTSTKELTASGGTSSYTANFKVPPLPPVTAIPYSLRASSVAELTTPGSYGVLVDVDDTSSTMGLPRGTGPYGLLVHASDADGDSRAAFYDTVAVGDRVEIWARDNCFFRYEVAEVRPDLAGPVPLKVFKVEYLVDRLSHCGPDRSFDNVSFRWGVAPGVEGEDGIREMLGREPTPGPGRYRITSSDIVIFIPAGMTLALVGGGDGARALEDVESGSLIVLIWDGTEESRTVVAPADGETAVGGTDDSSTAARDVNALFDELVASVEVIDP
ncbi:MAG: LuxR C-terminal-related transcriptional regulator [Chloroflexota bacterium]|nr:LuxR C-terminal-related transcriptional regulator [Chloroflexota bacterium]